MSKKNRKKKNKPNISQQKNTNEIVKKENEVKPNESILVPSNNPSTEKTIQENHEVSSKSNDAVKEVTKEEVRQISELASSSENPIEETKKPSSIEEISSVKKDSTKEIKESSTLIENKKRKKKFIKKTKKPRKIKLMHSKTCLNFIFVLFALMLMIMILFITFPREFKTLETSVFVAPYQRNFNQTMSFEEKFNLSHELFKFYNKDYTTYYEDLAWDNEINFVEMPTSLSLIEQDENRIVFENKTTLSDDELKLMLLYYQLTEEAFRQEELVENGQEVYDFTRYDELSEQISEQAKKMGLLDENSESEEELPEYITMDVKEKENKARLLVGLHTVSSKATTFDQFALEYNQLQTFLYDYLDMFEVYARLVMINEMYQSKELKSLMTTANDQINTFFLFYQNQETKKAMLLGKLEYEGSFDKETNTLTSHIIFNFDNGQYEEAFQKVLDSVVNVSEEE